MTAIWFVMLMRPCCYFGDANLDCRVDGSDYTLIDNGFHHHGLLTGGYNGDFNYDGKIDGSDYALIDNTFNMQGARLSANIAPSAQIACPSQPDRQLWQRLG